MARVLVLNATYEPINVCTLRRAAVLLLKEKAELGEGHVRVAKDTDGRLHACMIPWDELDALSERERLAGTNNREYKQADRDNVLAIPQQLKELKKLGWHQDKENKGETLWVSK